MIFTILQLGSDIPDKEMGQEMPIQREWPSLIYSDWDGGIGRFQATRVTFHSKKARWKRNRVFGGEANQGDHHQPPCQSDFWAR